METKTQLSMNIFSKPINRKKRKVPVYITAILLIVLAFPFFNASNKNVGIAESSGNTDDSIMAGSENNAGSPGQCLDKCGDSICNQPIQYGFGGACYESEFNCQKDCASSLTYYPAI